MKGLEAFEHRSDHSQGAKGRLLEQHVLDKVFYIEVICGPHLVKPRKR